MALKIIERWSELWQLKINESKSSFQRLGKCPIDPDQNIIYSIAGHPLLQSGTDLGIEIDPNLKFSAHIENITSRAFRRLGVLCKAFTCRDLIFMKQAYTTYVRPVLKYCQIWSTTLIKYIDLIENVQRSFTRRIPVLNNLSYPERLAKLDIETLELRRLKFDLLMYYKIIRGCVRIQCDDLIHFSINPYPTRGNQFKHVMPIVINNNLSNMFACRCVGIWNSLPDEVVNSPSPISFKHSLKQIDLSKFLKGRAHEAVQSCLAHFIIYLHVKCFMDYACIMYVYLCMYIRACDSRPSCLTLARNKSRFYFTLLYKLYSWAIFKIGHIFYFSSDMCNALCMRKYFLLMK